MLRDLHAEMAALVEPIGTGDTQAAPEEAKSPGKPDQNAEAKQEKPKPSEAPAAEVDDSPALRRILHRRAGK